MSAFSVAILQLKRELELYNLASAYGFISTTYENGYLLSKRRIGRLLTSYKNILDKTHYEPYDLVADWFADTPSFRIKQKLWGHRRFSLISPAFS